MVPPPRLERGTPGSTNGPTTTGAVRIFVKADGFEVPMDFEPDEAEEIAEELRAAAARARSQGKKKRK